jgi:tRNA wybutosine-synthesizing protein 2
MWRGNGTFKWLVDCWRSDSPAARSVALAPSHTAHATSHSIGHDILCCARMHERWAGPLHIALLVPCRLVGVVRAALEGQGQLDRTTKIRPWRNEAQGQQGASGDHDRVGEEHAVYRIVPTLLQAPADDGNVTEPAAWKRQILREIGLEDQFAAVSVVVQAPQTARLCPCPPPLSPSPPASNPLAAALQRWLHALPAELCSSLGISTDQLLQSFPKGYSLYHPLVLLPANAFASAAWSRLLLVVNPEQRLGLYKGLTAALNSTHLALNAPIPLLNDGSDTILDRAERANVLRTPAKLKPLYGEFGARLLNKPDAADFENAFWVSTRQNGIYQTWAPLYTMFSRGNISEKARILNWTSLWSSECQCSAVDLYAGIGYFAFSYAAAGVERVFCWELNPWSVEGLKRGAEANRWDVLVVCEGDNNEPQDAHREKIVVFPEDNRNAPKRLQAWRGRVPPVLHINCGLLPTSEDSWQTAVELLDEARGGWVHVHENIAVKDVELRRDEILTTFRGFLSEVSSIHGDNAHTEPMRVPRTVECQHVQRVKSFAPGVAHYVLDIWISGSLPGVV